MSLECAHCGTRVDDNATRCPKCLRTALLSVASAPKALTRKQKLTYAAIGCATVLSLGAMGITVASYRARPTTGGTAAVNVPGALEPLVDSPELSPLITRLRREQSPTARARLAITEVKNRRRAHLADEDSPVPPPRSPTLVWRLLPSAQGVVTELDLARLVATLLRGAGDPAEVVERTGPLREGEPTTMAPWLGAYMVRTGEQLVDLDAGTVLPASEFRHTVLSPTELGGAIAAQAAVEAAGVSGMNDRALEWARSAVEAWTNSPTPLAARAHTWLLVGASSGLDLADQDLRAAIALRDDGPLHFARARVLLARSDIMGAALESRRAASMARDWGTANLAVRAFSTVLSRLDAGTLTDLGCPGLERSRAPWTDDAYALCSSTADSVTRNSAAQRLIEHSHAPLRLAWAAHTLRTDSLTALRSRLSAPMLRETSRWMSLLGDADLASELLTSPDGGP